MVSVSLISKQVQDEKEKLGFNFTHEYSCINYKKNTCKSSSVLKIGITSKLGLSQVCKGDLTIEKKNLQMSFIMRVTADFGALRHITLLFSDIGCT